jgi:hypothetical protein
MRTTSGPTSRNEVVPRSPRLARSSPSVERRSKRIQRPQYFVRAQSLRGGTRGRSLIRAALFAARCRCRCRSRGRKRWRERPSCARLTWPRARPEGSLTPWPSLSRSVSAMVAMAARSALCWRLNRARSRARFPGRTGPVFPGTVGPQARRLHVRFAAHTFPGSRPGNRAAYDVDLPSAAVVPCRTRRPSRRRCCICAWHRARRCASLRPRVRAAFGP